MSKTMWVVVVFFVVTGSQCFGMFSPGEMALFSKHMQGAFQEIYAVRNGSASPGKSMFFVDWRDDTACDAAPAKPLPSPTSVAVELPQLDLAIEPAPFPLHDLRSHDAQSFFVRLKKEFLAMHAYAQTSADNEQELRKSCGGLSAHVHTFFDSQARLASGCTGYCSADMWVVFLHRALVDIDVTLAQGVAPFLSTQFVDFKRHIVVATGEQILMTVRDGLREILRPYGLHVELPGSRRIPAIFAD